MTNQPNPTPPAFVPVPALPIVVLSAPKGVRLLSVAGRVLKGATFREAIDAASAQPTSQEGRS